MSILLVDDSAENLLLLQSILQTGGYKDLLTAESAEQAFKHLGMDSSGGDGTSVDLILMDIQMPGMDGFEATAAIRHREGSSGSHIPIIAMTAHAVKGYAEKCLGAAMDGYITKPLEPAHLYATLAKFSPFPSPSN